MSDPAWRFTDIAAQLANLPEDDRYAVLERAAIHEYEAGFPREHSERAAYAAYLGIAWPKIESFLNERRQWSLFARLYT